MYDMSLIYGLKLYRIGRTTPILQSLVGFKKHVKLAIFFDISAREDQDRNVFILDKWQEI